MLGVLTHGLVLQKLVPQPNRKELYVDSYYCPNIAVVKRNALYCFMLNATVTESTFAFVVCREMRFIRL